MNDLQKAFLRGACVTVLGFAATGLLVSFAATGLFVSIFLTPDEPKDTSKFEVLDQYQGCSVIRYTDPTSRWHYFLKCS